MSNGKQDVCTDCRLPVEQHDKNGYCPVEWMASWTDITRRENIVLRKKIAEKEAHDRRWEDGFRNIVCELIGGRKEFEIPNIVELVRDIIREHGKFRADAESFKTQACGYAEEAKKLEGRVRALRTALVREDALYRELLSKQEHFPESAAEEVLDEVQKVLREIPGT